MSMIGHASLEPLAPGQEVALRNPGKKKSGKRDGEENQIKYPKIYKYIPEVEISFQLLYEEQRNHHGCSYHLL